MSLKFVKQFLAETRAAVTQPIGSRALCCQRSGVGSLISIPLGSTMSPMRSGVGVVAIPETVRESSSIAFTVKIE